MKSYVIMKELSIHNGGSIGLPIATSSNKDVADSKLNRILETKTDHTFYWIEETENLDEE